MAYESPIKVERNQSLAEEAVQELRKLMNDEEAYIMYRVNLSVDVDKDELLKALRYDRDQYEKGYSDRDAELVRCKNCKHHGDEEPGMVYCPHMVGGWTPEDFFCKDGERRDDAEKVD